MKFFSRTFGVIFIFQAKNNADENKTVSKRIKLWKSNFFLSMFQHLFWDKHKLHRDKIYIFLINSFSCDKICERFLYCRLIFVFSFFCWCPRLTFHSRLYPELIISLARFCHWIFIASRCFNKACSLIHEWNNRLHFRGQFWVLLNAIF